MPIVFNRFVSVVPNAVDTSPIARESASSRSTPAFSYCFIVANKPVGSWLSSTSNVLGSSSTSGVPNIPARPLISSPREVSTVPIAFSKSVFVVPKLSATVCIASSRVDPLATRSAISANMPVASASSVAGVPITSARSLISSPRDVSTSPIDFSKSSLVVPNCFNTSVSVRPRLVDSASIASWSATSFAEPSSIALYIPVASLDSSSGVFGSSATEGDPTVLLIRLNVAVGKYVCSCSR